MVALEVDGGKGRYTASRPPQDAGSKGAPEWPDKAWSRRGRTGMRREHGVRCDSAIGAHNSGWEAAPHGS